MSLEDKPKKFPTAQIDGNTLKPLTEVLLDRRATSHFRSDPVPEEYLEAVLKFAAQAPSGYNLQPWRFLVLREEQNRKRLQKAAFNQEKIGEAPVMVVAFGLREEWKKHMHDVFADGVRRGIGKPETISKQEENVLKFLKRFPIDVWLTRQTMIAFTTMMLVAEAYGLDTAPMEGFDADAVRKEFNLPDEAEVIALLAIGFRKDSDKPYPGRFPLSEIVFVEEYGRSWQDK